MTRAPQPTPRLSRDRIVEAALRVIDDEGLGDLSMRRLAQELDVWPMALYRYFQDKEELVEAVVEAASTRIELPPDGGSWRAGLFGLLGGVIASVRRHPGLAVPVGAGRIAPGGPRVSEAGLRLLARGGCTGYDAVHAWRALYAFALGYGALGGDQGDPAGQRADRAAIAALSPEEYPLVVAAGDQLSAAARDETEFERGVDRLLDAFTGGGPRRAPAPQGQRG